jgi:hypothetical protein
MEQTSTVGKHATSIITDWHDGQDPDGTIIRYWNTDIVKFNRYWVHLNNGGWHTATTKTRMNQASNQFNLGYRVYQKDYQWYIVTPDGKNHTYQDGTTFSFARTPIGTRCSQCGSSDHIKADHWG